MSDVERASRQAQFLNVVSAEIATARFQSHLRLAPLGTETLGLLDALGRVLAQDVVAERDVPGFDRAGVDGFAVVVSDLAGASAERPVLLQVNPEVLTPGVRPGTTVLPGTATPIATGGMLPRGADGVVMIEHTQPTTGEAVAFSRPAASGAFVAMAGSDIAGGETVLRQGCQLTSRELGQLAAVGLFEVSVWRRPVVAIFSTGDEIVAPGSPIRPGQVFDSNAVTLAAAVHELGGVPLPLGIVPDEAGPLADMLIKALSLADMVLLSGGTSKGAGDLASLAVAGLRNPGLLVHGVALKPGKPLCLAVSDGKPVAVLPGFPTSAIMTFHTFIAPVIRAYAGLPPTRAETVPATLPLRVASEPGRMEFVLVSLVQGPDGDLLAYPTGKGSGAVTSFAQADGYFSVPAMMETVPSGSTVVVQRIGTGRAAAADLVIIGSHCVGLDHLVGALGREGVLVKLLAVGSTGGLAAARRGACDIAPIHLLDPATGIYNQPFLDAGLVLVRGYGRMQGLVFRPGDARFENHAPSEALATALADPACMMVNRNPGSGTRIVIDELLGDHRPAGHSYQARSHNGVVAAVAQGRADWGVAIEVATNRAGLGFLPLQAEHYDFVVPAARMTRAPVQRFVALIADPTMRAELKALGFSP